jgi:hypothetical protein
MTRAISVLLGLGLLATTGVAADFPRGFQEHAAVQESLGGVRFRFREFVPEVTKTGQNAALDFQLARMTISQRL